MTGALRPRFQDGLETGKKFEEREKQSLKLCQADQRVSEKGLLQPCSCDFFPVILPLQATTHLKHTATAHDAPPATQPILSQDW